MKFSRRLFLCLVFLGLTFSSAADEIYTVRRGNRMALIARKKFGYPIYTPNGSLARLMALNPHIKDPHKIYVGQKVILSRDPEVLPVQELPKEQEFPEETPKTVEVPVASQNMISPAIFFHSWKLHSESKSFSTEGNLTTKWLIEFPLTFERELSQEVALYAGAGVWIGKFDRPSGRSVSNDDILMSGFRSGLSYMKSDYRLSGELEYEQRPFIKDSNVSAIVVKNIFIPSFKVRGEKDILTLGNGTLGLGAEGAWLFSQSASGIQAKSGVAGAGEIYYRYSNLLFRSFYHVEAQDTSMEKRILNDFGIGVNLVLRMN